MKYVLYEGDLGAMLFTKEENIAKNPALLDPFVNKAPTATIEANSDSEAVRMLNGHMLTRPTKEE